MTFVNPGQQLGKLIIISLYYNKNKKRNVAWVKCECSKEQEIRNDSSILKRIGCKSCTRLKAIEIGTKFGKLTVMKSLGITKFYKTMALGYLCKCHCGKKDCKLEVEIDATNLRNGKRKSCGVCKKYRVFLPSGFKSKLRIKKHYLWNILQGIIQRINNPNHPNYYNYGQRGIELYSPWYNSLNFINDVETEIGPRPAPNMELDRIDPNKNYEPNNIRWVTTADNLANRRNCKKYRHINITIAREQVLLLLNKLTTEQYNEIKLNPLIEKLIKQLNYEDRKPNSSK